MTDFVTMTVTELKGLAKSRNISLGPRKTKGALIKLLRDHKGDEACAERSAPPSAYQPVNFTQPGDFTKPHDPLKGRNVSGRKWKMRPQKRTSSIVTKAAINRASTTWEEKEAMRARRKAVKEHEDEIKQRDADERAEKKARREEQEKRRAENEFKATQMQQLNLSKVGTKMKAMSKKQLRLIKKTRMNNKTGVLELVDAYAK